MDKSSEMSSLINEWIDMLLVEGYSPVTERMQWKKSNPYPTLRTYNGGLLFAGEWVKMINKREIKDE